MEWKGLKTLIAKMREFIPRYGRMQQEVHCPNYDCDAIITTRIRRRSKGRVRHVAVETCSLLPKQPLEAGARISWVPDIPYQDLKLRGGERPPRYTMGVPCRETCLLSVNGEVNLEPSWRRGCVMGMYDGLEIERAITHKTLRETTPFKTPEAYCG